MSVNNLPSLSAFQDPNQAISAFQQQQQPIINPVDLNAIQNAFLGVTAQPNVGLAQLGAGANVNPQTNPFGFLSNVFAGDLAQRQAQQASESKSKKEATVASQKLKKEEKLRQAKIRAFEGLGKTGNFSFGGISPVDLVDSGIKISDLKKKVPKSGRFSTKIVTSDKGVQLSITNDTTGKTRFVDVGGLTAKQKRSGVSKTTPADITKQDVTTVDSVLGSDKSFKDIIGAADSAQQDTIRTVIASEAENIQRINANNGINIPKSQAVEMAFQKVKNTQGFFTPADAGQKFDITNPLSTIGGLFDNKSASVNPQALLGGTTQVASQPISATPSASAATQSSLIGKSTSKPDGDYNLNGQTITVQGGKIVSVQ